MCLKRKSDGILIVDLSGEVVPLQLKLNLGIGEIISKKRIILDVSPQNIPTGIDVLEEDQ